MMGSVVWQYVEAAATKGFGFHGYWASVLRKGRLCVWERLDRESSPGEKNFRLLVVCPCCPMSCLNLF